MSLDDIGGTLNSPTPRSVTYIVTACLSIALYNVLELTFLLFFTFKRRKGLYFWSFLVATWAIALYSIGFILKDFNVLDIASTPSLSYFYVTLIITGWCAMVTGQSMVLYSRLHLIVRQRSILHFVLAMIILDAILLQIPTIVLCYGANSPQYSLFATPYAVTERVEVTVFFVQESTISALYMYETCRMFFFKKDGGGTGDTLHSMHGEAGRRLMLHLIYLNVIVVLLDTAILVLQFTGRYASQTAAKGLIYSVKLKLEYDILNRLVELVQRSGESSSGLNYGSMGSQEGSQGEHGGNGGHRRRSCCPCAEFARKVEGYYGRGVKR